MVHMITLDEEYLEKGLIRTCIRTGVQQIREKKLSPAEQSLVIAGVQKNQVAYFLSNIEAFGYI